MKIMKIQARQRLQMCGANTLIDFAKKVFPKDTGSSTHRLQQLAANADDKQLAGVPRLYC
jgi:hypothetical protein